MVCCDICEKSVDYPFRCNYCGGLFCGEHRLPESHNCKRKPSVPPIDISAPRFREPSRKIGTCPKCHYADSKVIKYSANKAIFKCLHCGIVYGQRKVFPYNYFRVHKRKRDALPQPTHTALTIKPIVRMNKRSGNKKPLFVVFFAVAIILTMVLLVGLNNPFFANPASSTNSLSTETPNSSVIPIQSPTATPRAISEAEQHELLVNYTLSLINTDRQANSLQNVTLNAISSGQDHADDMLKNSYFSHWDMNGYKPYMRYSLAGGKGAVAENIAAQLGSYSRLTKALEEMESNMMNDDAAWNWGHRDNILNPLHNKVSIGIAFDSNNIYLVQDFEDDYISWNQLSVNNNQVVMQGTIKGQNRNIQQIVVFYDNPASLNVSQLEQPPYNGGYDAGTHIAMVMPPAPAGSYYDWSGMGIIGIEADNWSQNGNSFQISFSLAQAVAVHGNGVYTIYMESGTSTADSLTTYSFWV